MRRRSSGELEAKVLAALWSGEESASVQQVLDRLQADVAYTTVAKVLDRLVAKGTVTRQPAGRAFLYQPVADESTFVASRIRTLLDRAGDRSAALLGLVQGLDPEDNARLLDLLREAEIRKEGR